MPDRGWTTVTFWSGISVFFVFTLLQLIEQPSICAASHMTAEIIDLQFARSEAEMRAIFDLDEPACRLALAENLVTSLYVDLLALIPAFTFFTLAFFLIFRRAHPRLALLGLLFVAAGAVADLIETLGQMDALYDHGPDMPYDPVTDAATRTKYAALALTGLIAAASMLQVRRPVAIPFALVAMCGSLVVTAALLRLIPPQAGLGMFLTWLAMIGWAAILRFGAGLSPAVPSPG